MKFRIAESVRRRGKLLRFNVVSDGSVSIVALFLTVAIAAFAAIGLDFAQLRTERTLMQSTADAVAHAALYERELNDADYAINAALDLVETMMPADEYGSVISSNDVTFGYFDYDTRKFKEDADSKSAVRVRVQRNAGRLNSIPTYLFRLVGIDDFDVTMDSVFVTYIPTCFEEGFVAEVEVDIQSNNSYFNGFCIHSNGVVSINSNNYFEGGTIVSMTNLDNLELPQSGEESNDGLSEALREVAYRLRIVARIPTIIDSLYAGEDTYLTEYGFVVNDTDTLSGKTFTAETDFKANTLYKMSCPNGKVTINGVRLEDVVILTDCEVKFGQGLQIVDSLLVTTDTSATSFNSPSSLTLGEDDSCAEGGGATLVTKGGVSFTSDLHIYGSQILAAGDVEFSANAEGVEGASIVSGGTISGTSNMNMGFCGSGMEHAYSAEYFRMAF